MLTLRHRGVSLCPCALSDILATSPDNLAKSSVKMVIESRRRHFYAFEFYKIWHLYINIGYIYKF